LRAARSAMLAMGCIVVCPVEEAAHAKDTCALSQAMNEP
jgi:hypothetical protein